MADDGTRVPVSPRKEWFTLNSPIGVIGGFAAVVEVALILSAIWIDGYARWVMIFFAIVAFFYVANRFFSILTTMPWVLYPPKEYGGETGIVTYMETISAGAAKQLGEGGAQVPTTTVTLSQSTISAFPQPTLAASTEAGESDGFLVFMAPRQPDSLGLFVDYEAFDSVTHCLGYIGNTLLQPVESDDATERNRRHDMNYGTSWVLRETKTQRVLEEIGPLWAWKQSGNLSDMRLLRDTELKPGMHLELDRLRDTLLPVTKIMDILMGRETKYPRDEGAA